MKKKFLTVIILILCGAVSLALRTDEKFSLEGFSMNTLIRMTAYSRDKKILDSAYDLLNKLDKELSMYDPSSDISKINFTAGTEKVNAPAEVVEAVKNSLRLYELTGGVFNPLIGPVTKLWKINQGGNFIPNPESLDAAVKLSNIKNLEISGGKIFLKTKGCVLDLGGMAKGFASDKIAELFKNSGVKSALIDLGGNICVVGKKPDGTNWNIGVRDPSSPYGVPALVLSVNDTSVITSGGYERFKTVGGKKYSHFFDVKTGESITNDLLSVTVISSNGSLADGLATAFMASGWEKSLEIMKNIPDPFDVIFIRLNGDKIEISASGNLRDAISRERYEVKFF